MSTGDRTALAATWECPLCPLVGLVRADDPAGAAVAVADALEAHLHDHHEQKEA